LSKRLYQLKGIYQDSGKIRLANRAVLEWAQISEETAPSIPYGTQVEINIQIEDRDYLKGAEGVVWATYDKPQAAIHGSSMPLICPAVHISTSFRQTVLCKPESLCC